MGKLRLNSFLIYQIRQSVVGVVDRRGERGERHAVDIVVQRIAVSFVHVYHVLGIQVAHSATHKTKSYTRERNTMVS